MLNILFIGDIVGKPGRNALSRTLSGLVEEHSIHLCVGNAENAAGGFGLTPQVASDLFDLGIHVLTSGNHIFDKREIIDHLAANSRILRPANYPAETPGKGSCLFETKDGIAVGVLNLMGRVFMDSIDCPFKRADEEIERLREKTNLIFVDMHAEVTSEKVAMGRYLDGRVSAVVGSHTHVQTADEEVLPNGTAYLTDAGMTGPSDSVIGIKTDGAISRFRTRLPKRLETAAGLAQINGAVVGIDRQTGKAKGIRRIQIRSL
ncbi:metallophosphoesterase [Candidatus Nitromaritima sp. SCGC AAA799-C22]|nr:metallophosphoesterase [Candidatus Nitromaritima sp. SCGC AAA799-C22]